MQVVNQQAAAPGSPAAPGAAPIAVMDGAPVAPMDGAAPVAPATAAPGRGNPVPTGFLRGADKGATFVKGAA